MPEHTPNTFSADGLTWTDASLWQQFAALADADPQALAVVAADGRHWSRGEMRAMAEAAQNALLAAGVQPHDRVMLQGCKNTSVLAAALGISAVGAVICPYTPDLGAAERRVLDERLGHVAVFDDSVGEPVPGLPGLHLSTRERNLAGEVDERNARTALIGFTSGTTGVPKGVMHSPTAMNYAVRACEWVAGLTPGDPILGLMPWGSAPGFTFTAHFSLALGHPLVIVDRWDPLETLKIIDAHGCRWGICVPTNLVSMVEVARSGKWSKPSPLKALGVGGGTMTPELIRAARELLGIPALRMFGMSECMGHASTHPGDALDRLCHSDGKSFPGTRDEAFDTERRMLPRGERGQAGVKGPSLFIGYCRGLGDQEYNLTPDGYFLTGDEIICDPDGSLKVVGRIKDQIIRGGYNIDPAEVEAALLSHPAIAMASVVAVPEARLGEQACAVCKIRDGHRAPTLEDVKSHLATIGLSKKKWPEHLIVVEDLAYTTTGKVDKKRLSRLVVSELQLG
ncbi:class I adenylate-forming enzyme family protein [Azoarcus sp. KH32C]|uniref:class I adenylate-forming enzyme family protein n=1 Tax=Azoarcus sp. KH32C TaxID=748247 RepID=UPI00023863E3|nr:AMP-binding protein [Azoarcus sp. KH32C]BAL24638.1 AMP-dependent synthetase and ligase [Azoarcus sp. KH32C]